MAKNLEPKFSKTGLPIFSLDGVNVASSYDPEKEAKKWVDRQEISAPHIFVLGLGCGYHSIELARRHVDKKILVIEQNEDVKDWFHQAHKSPKNHIIISRAEEILPDCRFYEVVQSSQAIRLDEKFFARQKEILNSRTPEFLIKNLEWRGEQRENFVDVERTSLISIKEVLRSIDQKEIRSTSAHAWRTLGELLK